MGNDLTEFQKRVEQRLTDGMRRLGRRIEGRAVNTERASASTTPETAVSLTAGDLQLWIYDDTASFAIAGKGDYFELPDYGNADALADALLAELGKRMRG